MLQKTLRRPASKSKLSLPIRLIVVVAPMWRCKRLQHCGDHTTVALTRIQDGTQADFDEVHPKQVVYPE